MALVPAAEASAPAGRAKPTGPPTSHAISVSVDASEPGVAVPSDFLGLSFEVAALRQIASYGGGGNLVTLLRSLGGGVLRFGGVTADEQIAWTDSATPSPPWALGALGASDLRALDSLAAESGWRILLTLGLGHYEPEAAAREAVAAKAALGESLEAVELGNEPNAYAQHGLRSNPWTFVQYDEQVASYRAAIEAAAPGIPLAGPDTSGSSAYGQWGLGEAIYQRPVMLTGHHYPLGCRGNPPPSIARLLSPQIRQLEERSLRRYLLIAREAEVPFRLDETNSVSCGGAPGISDTFASALWSLSYMTRAMTMGVAGINLQGNPLNCFGYTPVCAPTAEDIATGELQVQPEWYALLLARALIGERPLATTISAPSRQDVDVTSFLAGDGALHFVIVDDELPGARYVPVRLQVGRRFHAASILALTAPSPEALSGVTLGGQTVAPDGLWSQPARLPHAANENGVITVDLAPSSAVLLTVSPIVR